MRWLWGEDQGGRIYLYEPQREVVGFTPPIACLYPAARRLVLSERECFFPSTVRVLRLGEELNESVRLTNPSLRASSSSDFANILR